MMVGDQPSGGRLRGFVDASQEKAASRARALLRPGARFVRTRLHLVSRQELAAAERSIAVARQDLAKAEKSFEVERTRLLGRARRAEQRTTSASEEAAELRRALKHLAATRTEEDVAASPARRSGDQPPSFRYKLGEQRRLAHALRADHGVSEPVLALDSKLAGRDFAERLGVRVPRLIAGPIPLSEISLESLPDRFVIKPLQSHSARGVFALAHAGDGTFVSMMDGGELLDEAEVKGRYEAARRKRGISPEVLIEELLVHDGPDGPQMPVDWKLFCFFGQVGLIHGLRKGGHRSPGRHVSRFFDDEWNDLGVIRLDARRDPTIDTPPHADELVRTARQLSEAIPRSMLRIDLYSVEAGVFFGELTPGPGGPWILVPDADERLGTYWERAEARLLADAIKSGVFDPRP